MRAYLILFLLLVCGLAFGQTAETKLKEIRIPFIQSPNAASLGIYGKVDISPFTGLPNINVPVFSLANGDISVTAELRYFAGGVKLEDHNGWVGQNWSLNVGGVVTRKRNGGLDEAYLNNGGNLYSYIDHSEKLDVSNWNTSSFMTPYLTNGTVDFYGMSTPDEFMFTLPNGKSGSFMKSEKGRWVVKSEYGGNMKVSVSISPFSGPGVMVLVNPTYPDLTETLGRTIYKIVITDNEGYEFTFGDTVNAIEFSRGGINLAAGKEPADISANAWNLVKIKSPNGKVVNFVYDRGTPQFMQGVGFENILNFSINASANSCNFSNSSGPRYNGHIINPSFLREINSESFKVIFEKQISNELKYPYNAYTLYASSPDFHPFNDFYEYLDLKKTAHGNTPNGKLILEGTPHVDYKLKGITVLDHNGKLRENYELNYNDMSNQRLFLKSFVRKSIPDTLSDDGYSPDMVYNFYYNNEASLPGYNSLMTDEWGYYNGKVHPITVSNAVLDESTLAAHYMADSAYAKKGSLIKIVYPTGGYTRFEYGLNQYGQYIQKSPAGISLVSGNGYGGGLRVEKIVSSAGDGTINSKQYLYSSSGTSSGILAGRKPAFFYIGASTTIGNISSDIISSNSINELNYTNGRDVVYSEVKEILEDGSSTVYKYSNSDNPIYRDELPSYIYSDGRVASSSGSGIVPSSNSYSLVSHTSKDLERGKLLSKTLYSAQGKKVSLEENTYNDDPTRFNQYVKSYVYSGRGASCSPNTLYESYVEPIKIYTYYPYLKSTKSTFYGLNEDLVNTKTTNYSYNNNYKVLQEESYVNSSNETVKTEYKYAFDLPGTVNNIMADTTTKNMTGIVLKKLFTVGANLVASEGTGYVLKTDTFQVDTTWARAGQGSVQAMHYKYDTKGNLVEKWVDRGPKTSYLWSYKNQYPIAELKNASYTAVQSTLGTAAITAMGLLNPNKSDIDGFLLPLKTGLPNAHVISYSHEPLIGVKSQTDAKGMATYYDYDGFGRLESVKDQNGYIVKNYQYNYADGSAVASTPGTYWNKALTIKVAKNNCTTGEGSVVAYTVGENTYSSATSQADADQKALDDANLNAQTTANATGTCTLPGVTTYSNIAKSATATRNNCDSGLTGSPVTYTIAAGTYNSTVSQAAADALAQSAADAGAQENANTYGTCTTPGATTYYSLYVNVPIRKVCPSGQTGSDVFYSIPAGRYTSAISQADANSKAQDDVNTIGQAYANAHGSCTINPPSTYYSTYVNVPLRKSCPAGQTGSDVFYSVPAGKYTSTISQSDANAKAQNEVNTTGQAYANANSVCTVNPPPTYYNTALTVYKNKNNCSNGMVGSQVAYTVAAYTYSSTASQADANAQAQADADANAQTYANSAGSCGYPPFSISYTVPEEIGFRIGVNDTYNNTSISYPISGTGTLNNIPGGVGSIIFYNIYGGSYSITYNGVTYPSMVSSATYGPMSLTGSNMLTIAKNYYNTEQTITKTRNNCTIGWTGSSVNYVVAANTYSSLISQADADQKAILGEDANAQAYANTNGTCTPPVTYYSAAGSLSKTRNNCIVGYTGSTVNYTVAYGKYTSLISQADANQKAQDDLNANAQAYANTNGTCSPPVTYYSAYASVNKPRNNCAEGSTGSMVNYSVSYGKYTSLISQADANQKAQDDLNANAQAYANTIGTCSIPSISMSYSLPAGKTFQVLIYYDGGDMQEYIISSTTGTINNIPRGSGSGTVQIYNITENDNNTYYYKYVLNGGMYGYYADSASFYSVPYNANLSLTITIPTP